MDYFEGNMFLITKMKWVDICSGLWINSFTFVIKTEVGENRNSSSTTCVQTPAKHDFDVPRDNSVLIYTCRTNVPSLVSIVIEHWYRDFLSKIVAWNHILSLNDILDKLI